MNKLENTRKKECDYCEEIFEYKIKRGRDPKYCSDRCKRKRNRELDKNRYIKNCKECGQEFRTSHKNQKYCSIDCRDKDSWKNKREKIKCKICGDQFLPNKSEQKYCSQQCGSEAAAKTMKENGTYDSYTEIENSPINKKYSDEEMIVICENCGKEFRKSHYDRDRKYCSRDCFYDAIGIDKKEKSNLKQRKSDYHMRKRAKRFNVKVEEITPIEIFKRDNWACQICGKKVKKDKYYPDPMSPSIDHIIPLSKGGDHIKKNVQLTHLRCNIKKQDKVMTN